MAEPDVAWIVNRHGAVVDVPADRLEDILQTVKGTRLATADEVPGKKPAARRRKADQADT